LRINRYLASCNVASRRKCEEIILSGQVKVNGELIRDLSYQIDEKNDQVSVRGKIVEYKEDFVYYILNKPEGVISAVSSRFDEPTVTQLIHDEPRRIYPVGRLDKDTEGLIFLTNDGDLSYRLTHPKFEKTKVYEALLKGRIDERGLTKLSKGVMLDGRKTSDAQVVLLKMIKGDSLIRISIREGRNRQIRRMCEMIGHPVVRLKRIEEAGLRLGELKPGEYRKLNKNEIKKLYGADKEK